MAEEGHKVSLNVYDLSQGLARQLSASFLGKVIEGIWHTGVVVYGNEYYFGGGIQHAPVGTTPYGTPVRVVELGITHVPRELFEDYLQEISPRYTAETYSLLDHNCNNFSNEVAQFLVGAAVPDYIMQLPNEVKNSPMGHLILPMIQQLETSLRSGAVPQAPQFRPPASATQTSSPAKITVSRSLTKASTTSKPNNERLDSGNVTDRTPEEAGDSASPAVKLAKSEEETSSTSHQVPEPLGDARRRVQEEITREFVAIMASGTLRASEAAALATRRVMERYGGSSFNVASQ